MPPTVTMNSSRVELPAEMPLVIAGQRFAQFWNAALPGVEGLAVAVAREWLRR